MTRINTAYNEMVQIMTSNGRISLTIVEKQSESGLTYNQRLLFLLHNHCIGYLTQFNLKGNAENINITYAKVILPLQQISFMTVEGKNLKIKYGERNFKWMIFRFINSNLAQKWLEVITNEINMLKLQEKQVSVYESKKSEKVRSRQASEISDTTSQASFFSNNSSSNIQQQYHTPTTEEKLNPQLMWRQMMIKNRQLEAELAKKNQMIQNMGYQIGHLQNRVLRLEDRNQMFRH